MTHYLVTWEIDSEADSPEEAAMEALLVMQDKQSEALNFTVIECKTKKKYSIDLDD